MEARYEARNGYLMEPQPVQYPEQSEDVEIIDVGIEHKPAEYVILPLRQTISDPTFALDLWTLRPIRTLMPRVWMPSQRQRLQVNLRMRR